MAQSTSSVVTEQAPDWRAAGAKRYGRSGWKFEGKRRSWYLITINEVNWTDETFWRVGLCDRTLDGFPLEVGHLRYRSEAEALEAAQWLVACAEAAA